MYTPAKYGYEFVFNEIHKQLGLKVYVYENRWRFYSKIPNLVPGVTNDCNETRIHLCRVKNGDTDHLWCIGENKQKFLFVYLSAMKWQLHLNDISSVDVVSPSRVDVCFATHCSRSEIYHFVNYLSPDKIVGFPNDYVDISIKRTSKLEFDRDVKKVRVDKQVDENLLREMFG